LLKTFISSYLEGPVVEFEKVPANLLLTLNIKTPRAWVITPFSASHDLDNILLSSENPSPVLSEYSLDRILVEGVLYSLPFFSFL